MPILIEVGLLALIAVLGAIGANFAVHGVLGAAALRGLTGPGLDSAGVLAAGQRAQIEWVAAVALLVVARVIASRRRGTHIPTPILLPAVATAMALGLCIQLGYGNPFSKDWPGPDFANGILLASIVGSAILLSPLDPGEWIPRLRWPLAAFVVGIFGVMSVFGQAPGHSDQKVNLNVGVTVQPIELAKLGAVLFIAVELGRRASKLRYQRDRVSILKFPRPRLLLSAVVALLATLGGMLAVKDLGPTLILGGVFLAMYFVVTRSVGWVGLAVTVGAGVLGALWADPTLAHSQTVELRIRMWADPWFNGLAHGDQLSMARWALAAGGFSGVGLGDGFPGALAAGHTDLVYAHLVEELGQAGGTLYLGILVGIVLSTLHVGMRSRTPERAMMAAAIGFLITFQTATILGGTLGAIPLTGVVVPFLSHGKTGMIAFVAAVCLVGRLAQDGAIRAPTDEMRELARGIREGGYGIVALAGVAIVLTALEAVAWRDETTLRPAVTTLEEGQPKLEFDRRVRFVADNIRRGSILDRNGQPLAASPEPGTRIDPLGNALGTLLGPADDDVLRASWSLERVEDERLRGYPNAKDGPAIWLGDLGGTDHVVLAVKSAAHEALDEEARATAEWVRRGGTPRAPGQHDVRRVALATPDLSGLLPIVRLPLATRGQAIQKLSDDVASRSLQTTIDARLQAAVAIAVRKAAAKSQVGVAAAVVIDPANGQILARAQWPDYDPSAPETVAGPNDHTARTTDWHALRRSNDPRFMGVYGPWADKTGSGNYGFLQAGSVFKLVTSLAAVRTGLVQPSAPSEHSRKHPDDATCPTSVLPRYTCGPEFTLPGWTKPIHNHKDGGGTGSVDLIAALAQSSNVYFGQLGLTLGPQPYRDLLAAGVNFGLPGLAREPDGPYTGIGATGSRRLALTAFGQGAAAWTVTEAAQFTAALANGGDYRTCELRSDRPCADVKLVDDPSSLVPILSGMRAVMDSGTGAHLRHLKGVRIYGKTGTADAPGNVDEAPYGVKAKSDGQPHSWFVAIAESADATDCSATTTGRYAIATVAPHAGFGASVAGPLAIDIAEALQQLQYLPSGG